MSNLFRRQIALPQDHGSWVFILSPLIIGLCAAKSLNPATLALGGAAMAAFLLRQPVTIAIKAYSGRRPRSDLPAARFWMSLYGLILFISVFELLNLGFQTLLWLGIPAVPVFAWHLWLVSRREERRQAGIEIIATGVLALAAPAAYWVGKNSSDPLGWVLWILTWFQSAASIIYAYLRLEQREWKTTPALADRFRAGSRAAAYAAFNLLLTCALAASQIISPWLILPYLLQLAETLWGSLNPAIGARPTAIGIRQLIITCLFTVLFILAWK